MEIKKVLFLFSILYVLTIFQSESFALPSGALVCNVKPSCSADETPILKMSDTKNAHAGTVEAAPSYPYTVCCKHPETSLSRDCNGNGDVVLRLGGASNTHAQVKYLMYYPVQVCMASTFGKIDCRYAFPPNQKGSCASVGTDYTCVATMYNNTNAHIGNCSAYNTTVCCKFASAAERPPEITWDLSAAFKVALGGQGRMTIKIKNNLGTSDNVDVYLIGNPQKLHNWIWFEGHRYDERKYNTTLELGPGEEKAVAVNIFGGEVNAQWTDPPIVRVVAKSASTGLETEVSEYVSIEYSDNSITVETPEFGWLGFLLIALFGAILAAGSKRRFLSFI